jgi:hypothetical protein
VFTCFSEYKNFDWALPIFFLMTPDIFFYVKDIIYNPDSNFFVAFFSTQAALNVGCLAWNGFLEISDFILRFQIYQAQQQLVSLIVHIADTNVSITSEVYTAATDFSQYYKCAARVHELRLYELDLLNAVDVVRERIELLEQSQDRLECSIANARNTSQNVFLCTTYLSAMTLACVL